MYKIIEAKEMVPNIYWMIVEAPRCLQGRLPMVARLHDGVLLPASVWLHPLCSGGVSLA